MSNLHTQTIELNPTIDTSAFAAGDAIHTGAITLPGLISNGGEVELESIVLKENGGQAPSLTLLFFDTAVAGTVTANAAFAWGTGDLAACIGMVRIVGADWYTVNSKSVAHLGKMGAKMKGNLGSAAYLVIIADSAYDAVAATDLYIALHFQSIQP